MTASRPGQVNSSGDPKALFLKVFAGEVLTAFREANVALDRSMVRTIQYGSSAQFPATWKAAASYHTVGTMITGQTINSNERVITIDDLAISPVFIANIDEAMSQYEFRAEYSQQCGFSLAKMVDKNLFQLMVLAARASATVTGGNGGSQITSATAKTDADALLAAIFAAGQALDEKDVPSEDRSVFLAPAQYNLLIQNGGLAIHRDYNDGVQNGSVAKGQVFSVDGMAIVKTNHLPTTNVTTGPTAYQGDFTNTAAVVSHKSAVGTVKLLDLATESEYSVWHQGTLVVAKQALGHGILRPESAVEIKTA